MSGVEPRETEHKNSVKGLSSDDESSDNCEKSKPDQRQRLSSQSEAENDLPVLKIHNLNVSYGTNRALQDANLCVKASRICGLVGMNGAGKSTLFKAITRGLPQQSGTIEILGKQAALARKAGLIGYVPQSQEIDWDFPISVQDVVMMGRYGHMGSSRRVAAEGRAAVETALELMEITDLKQRQIGQLSGGQRKRVFIARALAQGARVLLLDEPFAGVDKVSEKAIMSLLRELAHPTAGTSDYGFIKTNTIVVSTHDLSSLEYFCDEVALLNRRVLFHGGVKESLEPLRLAEAFGARVEMGSETK